jgi:adenine-specific DNA-methyltransferase
MGRQTKRTNTTSADSVSDYRHEGTKRKNIPPAKMAAEGTVPAVPKIEYSYSPRRPPVLRFDSHGDADKLPELLAEAKKRKLTDDEVRTLAEALRMQEPWLEWAGKRELPGFAVDPVALHIHERVSAQAILKVAARQDAQRSLFADPEQEYHEAVQFYRHDIDWANRLILGDSLQVMASLAKREDLAGKVQMIYIDPPYGIQFKSNFQPEVGKRDVKDKETDLTREAEMVKAYRDTWHLGIHSYLSYLRDRLIVARELLADAGSIFVQISDENMHRVRQLLDDVFGLTNFVGCINFQTMVPLESGYIENVFDYLLWYAKDRAQSKYRNVAVPKELAGNTEFKFLEGDGFHRQLNDVELANVESLDKRDSVFKRSALESSGFTTSCTFGFGFEGSEFFPRGGRSWRTNKVGMDRLAAASRLFILGTKLYYKLFHSDFGYTSLTNTWSDTVGGFADTKAYVVQTNPKIIQRCLLMTTDPGDLVLDPTCGSGTTAYVAEQWGRRWITIDTSRVAVAIARQRLLTAKFDYHQLRDEKAGVVGGFAYKAVPHITLKSIAQNANLDPIFAKHEPILDAKLKACNAALANVPTDLRIKLVGKLGKKLSEEGVRAATDADRRRWLLPGTERKHIETAFSVYKNLKPKSVADAMESVPPRGRFQHWQVPFDTDDVWPKELQQAVTEYRKAWRAKMDEVNQCIEDNAEQEELVDQPLPDKSVKLRVSGPFTVEAVQPPEINLGDVIGQFGGEPGVMPGFVMREATRTNEFEVQNIEAYLTEMTRLLKGDGVRFPNNKEMVFSRLDRISDGHGIHAEGRWVPRGDTDTDPAGDATVGVVFGPQYGPFTVQMLEHLIKPAGRRYDDLVIAAFNFTAEVQDLAANPSHPKLKIHVAHIRPDVNPGMAGLLKERPGSQLFTVFGQPRTRPIGPDKNGEYTVAMEGVDVYNPVTNSITSTGAEKVAAWFLDSDYDGRTFCITQAFFPDKGAWEKLAKALGGVVDADRFEALSGTTSLPFPKGKHKCAAVKVIDPRGNEVMQVHQLP